jgi:hypothetical protein
LMLGTIPEFHAHHFREKQELSRLHTFSPPGVSVERL